MTGRGQLSSMLSHLISFLVLTLFQVVSCAFFLVAFWAVFLSYFCIFPFSCSSKSLSRTLAFACQRSSWSSWVLLCFEFLGSSLVTWPCCLKMLTDMRQVGSTSVGTARQACNVSFTVTTTRLDAILFPWNCRIEASCGPHTWMLC